MKIMTILISGLLIANTALAAKATKPRKRGGAELQTDVRFDNSMVHGKYQTADEVNVRVENEKVLSDLLKVRPNFKDRLLEASGQE